MKAAAAATASEAVARISLAMPPSEPPERFMTVSWLTAVVMSFAYRELAGDFTAPLTSEPICRELLGD